MTQSSFLPLSRPDINQSDIDAVVEVLKTGWITTGAKAAELEKLFCDYLGCKHAIALTSATAGMHLLLYALGIGPGDEVITPSMTWVSTPNMIVASGAKPVFVDVERDTLMTNAEIIEAAITPATRLIIPVHFAGSALNVSELRSLSRKFNIPLIEDAAHALGSQFNSQKIGAQGTSIFSLHPIKHITSGEGGMFCTNDDDLAARIRRLKFHGLGVDAYDRETQGRTAQAEVLEPGFKYNLPDMNAALAIGQMRRLDASNRQRTELAQHYYTLLNDVDEISLLKMPDYPVTHSWHLMVARINTDALGMSRDAFMQALKEKGIGSGLHFRAVHQQQYYRDHFTTAPGALANTEYNSEHILSLPLFPAMNENDVSRVVDAIKSIIMDA